MPVIFVELELLCYGFGARSAHVIIINAMENGNSSWIGDNKGLENITEGSVVVLIAKVVEDLAEVARGP